LGPLGHNGDKLERQNDQRETLMMARGWYSQTVNPSRLAVKPRVLRDVRFLFLIVLSSVLAVFGADLYRTHSSAGVDNGLRLNGLSAMSELELRETVDTSQANVSVVTILPPGQRVKETRSTYPQIATYVVKNAFRTVLSGGNNPDLAGFINADGNSVFYSNLDPRNAFVGIRGQDIEVQIFHPGQGTTLEIATTPGLLVPVT
jgi:hypothetical protein